MSGIYRISPILTSILYLSFKTNPVLPCGSTNSLRESELIQDPTFSFSLNPPVRWTYFPPLASTGTTTSIANFFPGQSTTSELAVQAAQNEVHAAFLDAMTNINYPIVGSISTTVTYSPDEISNCYTGTMVPAGTKIGYLASGAITQIALVSGTGATGVTIPSCPIPTSGGTIPQGLEQYRDYVKMVSVATRGGIILSRFQWERVAATMQSSLGYRYNARIVRPITINSADQN